MPQCQFRMEFDNRSALFVAIVVLPRHQRRFRIFRHNPRKSRLIPEPQHHLVRFHQIALRHDDVEVVEVAQRQVPVGLLSKHGPFIRNRHDPGGSEQLRILCSSAAKNKQRTVLARHVIFSRSIALAGTGSGATARRFTSSNGPTEFSVASLRTKSQSSGPAVISRICCCDFRNHACARTAHQQLPFRTNAVCSF